MVTANAPYEEMVSTGVAARMMGCSVELVRVLANKGALPYQRVGAWRLIPRVAVEAMVKEREEKAAATAGR